MIDWNNLLPSFLGALVGGLFVLIATHWAYKCNLKLSEKEKQKDEKITILSLNEELKVIMDCYKKEFEALFKTLKTQNHLTDTYVITQEYFTVYKNNAGKLGLIQDEKLRNLFIKIHILLNRFIEDLIIYRHQYCTHCERQGAFLHDFNPDLYKGELLKEFDSYLIIEQIRENPNKYISKKNKDEIDAIILRMMQFFNNYDVENKILRDKSLELKRLFEDIKKLYTKIQSIIGTLK
ncbi:MAG: hypothetical protein IJ529_00585 [Alphaproteobacteria bacterium]|nr:hypothetical protein [Alphaproteobacteria bacterium]MBQ9235310.1 hypothetical protein [Alphaproteobacteria bacterium]